MMTCVACTEQVHLQKRWILLIHFCSLSLLTMKHPWMVKRFGSMKTQDFLPTSNFPCRKPKCSHYSFCDQNFVVLDTNPYSPAPCCLPTRTSAPAMQPMPRMQTTIPMKCTALYRTSRKNQESSITTGMTKQSRSCKDRGDREEKTTDQLLTFCLWILG